MLTKRPSHDSVQRLEIREERRSVESVRAKARGFVALLALTSETNVFFLNRLAEFQSWWAELVNRLQPEARRVLISREMMAPKIVRLLELA